jgi:hypothetical protein
LRGEREGVLDVRLREAAVGHTLESYHIFVHLEFHNVEHQWVNRLSHLGGRGAHKVFDALESAVFERGNNQMLLYSHVVTHALSLSTLSWQELAQDRVIHIVGLIALWWQELDHLVWKIWTFHLNCLMDGIMNLLTGALGLMGS